MERGIGQASVGEGMIDDEIIKVSENTGHRGCTIIPISRINIISPLFDFEINNEIF